MKKNIEELIAELIHELGKMSIAELHQFRQEWISELRLNGSPLAVRDFCCRAIDAVIQKKIEKTQKILGGHQHDISIG